jgi:hypothetical protein
LKAYFRPDIHSSSNNKSALTITTREIEQIIHNWPFILNTVWLLGSARH